MKTQTFTASLLAVGLLFSSAPLLANSETDKKIEQLLATFADKPEEHKALAALYREQAADARKQAEQHRQFKAKYHSQGGKNSALHAGMRTHCDNLAKSFDDAGKSYDAMAAEHDKMAK